MSLDGHLSSLQKKHEELENEIAELSRHPSADELEITDLKKKKLRIKEEIDKTATA